MTELLPTVLGALAFSIASHMRSGYDRINATYVKKDRLFWDMAAVLLILFCGLRTVYNDTIAYTHSYELLEWNKTDFSDITWSSLGSNPGFQFINIVMIKMGLSSQDFLMICSIVTNGIYMWFLRKYSDNLWLSMFLYITMGTYAFTMAAMKQCLAVALCMIATDMCIRKKWIFFILPIVAAIFIHPYALMYLVIPFMFFKPWENKTWIMLIVFGLLGVSLQFLIGTVIDITSMLGEDYTTESFTGEGVNPFRLIVVAVPTVLSLMQKSRVQKADDRTQYLFLNLTMLNAEIMFVALFGTANYFARLANYFVMFQTITIPWIINRFPKNERKVLVAFTVVCYTFFFLYDNVIVGNFDRSHDGLTLIEYVQSWFTAEGGL